MDPTVTQLLDEWFGETRRDPATALERNDYWFRSDAARDRRLAERYGDLVDRAAAGGLLDWQDEAESRLALVLVLDQLPRNIHRGSPQAFASDPRAAALALAGIGTGMERALAPVEQAFFYMPLQHAEDRATQRLCVQQFRGLLERNPENPDVFGHFLKFAETHRDIVERFGRFPHRNAILRRESTAEELDYLQHDAPRFGQSA